MKNALVIAAREFEEKRFVLYPAVAFAILPFLFAVIPQISGKSVREAIALSSLILATGFTAGLAVMTGASFIGRDLSDGRMSFYFSRPVASSSIWFGKLAAGILMLVGCFGIIIAPAWLAAAGPWRPFWTVSLGEASVTVLAYSLALFLGAHVIGTFARSRSPLIAADFAAAVICGVVIRLLVLPLAAGQASTVISWMGIFLSIALAVAIIGGGAWQIERGRTDRRRNHLALSQFLWGTMAAALLIVAGYVAWVVSVKPSDISIDFRANGSTSGPFAVITGKSRGRADYRAGFLLNTEDDSVTRVSSFADWFVRYTRDGRSALIPVADSNTHTGEVLLYRKGAKKPIDTGLTIPIGSYFVSDDGGRLATISGSSILSVYDVAQERSLASVKLPPSTYVRVFFVSPDVLRIYLNTVEGMKIVELDVRTRGLRETGVVATKSNALIYPDSSAEHMLVRPAGGADTLTLNDARTGMLITTLTSGTNVKAALFLRDGRIVIVEGPESATVLHILSASGVPQREIPLGPSHRTMFVGDDGKRVVLFQYVMAGRGTLIAADLNRGVVERREAVPWWVPSGVVDPRPAIEPLRDVLYGDANGHIVSWNPATGAKRRIT